MTVAKQKEPQVTPLRLTAAESVTPAQASSAKQQEIIKAHKARAGLTGGGPCKTIDTALRRYVPQFHAPSHSQGTNNSNGMTAVLQETKLRTDIQAKSNAPYNTAGGARRRRRSRILAAAVSASAPMDQVLTRLRRVALNKRRKRTRRRKPRRKTRSRKMRRYRRTRRRTGRRRRRR